MFSRERIQLSVDREEFAGIAHEVQGDEPEGAGVADMCVLCAPSRRSRS